MKTTQIKCNEKNCEEMVIYLENHLDRMIQRDVFYEDKFNPIRYCKIHNEIKKVGN